MKEKKCVNDQGATPVQERSRESKTMIGSMQALGLNIRLQVER
jgi:hypothetical protein